MWIVLGVTVGRSVLGWLENAAEDGVFEWFEWKLLVATILRVGYSELVYGDR